MPIPREFNKNIFKKWSLEMAYVLGFIFADGTVTKNRRGAHYLELTTIDLELIKKLQKILKSDHRIGVRKYKNPNRSTSYRLQIGSKGVFEDLGKFGICPRKSLVVIFPLVPQKYLGHFVRGYFDGDGCVALGNYWRKDRNKTQWVLSTTFTSGSKKFLVGLRHSLLGHIENASLREKSNHSGFDLALSPKNGFALFQLMYNNVSPRLFLERKHKIFIKAFRTLNYNIAGVA